MTIGGVRLWPGTLAARLALLLLVAVAVAQGAVVLILRAREEGVVASIGHGQALNQTVALARLLSLYPADQSDTLASAFGSRMSCAFVDRAPPPAAEMAAAEQRLAAMIAPMLHGVDVGPARVSVSTGAPSPLCPGAKPFGSSAPVEDARAAQPGRAVVSMTLPFSDGRWLTTRTIVGDPGGWAGGTLLSFLASSLAVACVAVLAVRRQTQSLRALALASDQFGRGKAAAPLATDGPAEVAAASRAFNTMRERLDAFIKDRLRLLASVSHDLRTPLTTLRLKAEFVEDESIRDGLIATIEELSTIVEATLTFSRAEATSEKSRLVDLAGLCRDVAAELGAAGASVAVSGSAPCLYACRPVALKRALRNLVENALRYGGSARVAIERRSGGVAIRIDDDGPGIPENQIEDAFKPFVRIEPSRNAETGGLGLGLAIANGIVKAHGGSLRLYNRPKGGLTAELSLPETLETIGAGAGPT